MFFHWSLFSLCDSRWRRKALARQLKQNTRNSNTPKFSAEWHTHVPKHLGCFAAPSRVTKRKERPMKKHTWLFNIIFYYSIYIAMLSKYIYLKWKDNRKIKRKFYCKYLHKNCCALFCCSYLHESLRTGKDSKTMMKMMLIFSGIFLTHCEHT